MSRKVLMIVFFSVAAVFGITLILLNVFRDKINPEIKINYCDRNPESLICTASNPTEEEITEDLLVTVIQQYNGGYDDTFCTDYFSGNIVRYCTTNSIMPNATYLLSYNVVVEYHEDGVYNVYSKYRTEHPAYMFRVGVDSIDGVYKITGLSFFEIDPTENLFLLDIQIEDFMIEMIESSTSLDENYCLNYFYDDAFDDCTSNILNVAPQDDIIVPVEITELDINTFEYKTQTEDELTTYIYTITFQLVDQELKINSIEFELEIIE